LAELTNLRSLVIGDEAKTISLAEIGNLKQ